MLPYIIGFTILAVIIFAWWKMSRKGKIVGVIKPKDRQQAIIDSLTAATVVDGAMVLSRMALSEDVKQGIKDAFFERTEKAKMLGWTKGFNPADYTIYVFPSVRDIDLDGNYSPVFQVFLLPSDSYIGSVYDHGGWIYAAEQIIMNGIAPTNKFIITANNSREYTQNAVANGLDHLLAYKNDRALYERTKDHSDGVSRHPLW